MSGHSYSEQSLEWRVRSNERRLEAIEALKPEVMAYEIRELRDDVRSLKRAFYTFSFSVVGSAIVFAFTVFALIGDHHP